MPKLRIFCSPCDIVHHKSTSSPSVVTSCYGSGKLNKKASGKYTVRATLCSFDLWFFCLGDSANMAPLLLLTSLDYEDTVDVQIVTKVAEMVLTSLIVITIEQK